MSHDPTLTRVQLLHLPDQGVSSGDDGRATVAGRVLGVDPGEARIGLALSDLLGLTAQPAEHLQCIGSRRDLNNIAQFARDNEVGAIVIGLPLTLAGDEGPAAQASRAMAEGLKRRLPRVRIELWDERMTTVQAERTLIDGKVRRKGRKQKVDSLAAALILQSWLDAHPGVVEAGA